MERVHPREATKVRLRIGKADRRGAPSTIRRYLVGTTTVQITFRKQHIAAEDVLDVLERVRNMVENDPTGLGNTGI